MYDEPNTSTGQGSSDLNEVRFRKFSISPNDKLRKIPPSTDALILKVDRSEYQSGWVWGNSTSQSPCPLVTEWGWEIHGEDLIKIQWQKCAISYKNLMDAVRICHCKNCVKCKCLTEKINCLYFCACNGKCK